MTHTPGPWEEVKRTKTTIINDSKGLRIAMLSVRPNTSGNARLIAAAPDLLEACEMALEGLCAGFDDWMLDDTETALNNAIAKARGE